MGTILWIALAIVFFIALLVGGMILVARRHARALHDRMTADLNEAVARQGLTIDEMDFLMRRVIAIDHARQVVLYIDCNGDEDVVETFDCGQISNCKIARSGTGVRESRNGLRIADEGPGQIGLLLKLKNRQECYLQFYNEIRDGLDERSQLDHKATKWCGILNKKAAPRSTAKSL